MCEAGRGRRGAGGRGRIQLVLILERRLGPQRCRSRCSFEAALDTCDSLAHGGSGEAQSRFLLRAWPLAVPCPPSPTAHRPSPGTAGLALPLGAA